MIVLYKAKEQLKFEKNRSRKFIGTEKFIEKLLTYHESHAWLCFSRLLSTAFQKNTWATIIYVHQTIVR